MIKSFSSIGLCIVSLGLAAPASAHHSAAMFDRTKQTTIKGTIKEFQWTNPHVWIQIMVPNAQGVAEEWSIEAGSPNMLYRQGWDDKAFKPGDQVSLTVNPLRNGGHGGSFLAGVLANGKQVGNANARLPG